MTNYEELKNEKGEEKQHYLTHVVVNGIKYAFKALVTEYYPLTCAKCGGQVELNSGFGQCPYCKTNYSATVMLKEITN